MKLLKAKHFEEIDLENLIEELGDLGNEKKHRIESLLEQLIRHLLLLQYWEAERDYNKSHWESEIVNCQNQLDTYLIASLRNHLEENLSKIYHKALRYFCKKTQNSIILPDKCPYSLDELLNCDW